MFAASEVGVTWTGQGEWVGDPVELLLEDMVIYGREQKHWYREAFHGSTT